MPDTGDLISKPGMTDAEVAERARRVADAARDGRTWLEQNAAQQIDEPAIARVFGRFARRANRLRIAATRPTAVAVFGASQAGKSYLVSGLAAPRGGALIAQYGDERLDFLKDLNPEGGKESTGLVSRFTVRRDAAPAGRPVPLRLLSQTDVVKILANTFLEDFQHADLELLGGEGISVLLGRLEQQAGPGPRDGLVADDIEEMREYFDLYFRGKEVIRDLSVAYWARAADLIPRLPAALRAEAYAPLWNHTAAFTELCRSLIAGLEQIGFADTAFCDTNALLRRGGNLLDAATVLQLGGPSTGMIDVATTAGARVAVDRAVLTALIAEVTVPLAERPWDFFGTTDLLDFPGARSRKDYDSVDKALAAEQGLGELFLRGKVAYLFQRYSAEQEIAAMLLCVGPSVQEVSTLPRIITAWIGQTIGASPEARGRQRNSLFIVLTKFDMELDGKKGEDIASGQRWTNRLTASLLEPFGSSDWPTAWTPGRPFDNVYWLRSTAVPFHAVYDYGPDGHETVAERGRPFIAERFEAYERNNLVRAHFADPRASWDAALVENDGGISYLANALRPVCDPALKQQQIIGRIAELAGEVAGQLRPHFHTGDLAAELRRARQAARAVIGELARSAEMQMFGALLRSLQVTSDQVGSVWWALQTAPDDGPVPIGRATSQTSLRKRLQIFDEDEVGQPAFAATAAPAQARDRFEKFADNTLQEWVRSMGISAEDPDTATALHVSREQAVVLVRELERAARRLDLRGGIAGALRQRASFHHRSATAAQQPIVVVEQAINGFVHQLGFDRVPFEQRPEVRGENRRIFPPPASTAGMPALGKTAAAYDEAFYVDWMTALSQVFEANAQDSSSGNVDVAANIRLGKLLVDLDGAVA